ncbi:MAG TPA: SGNH/GDSL hydrolase family protein [Burkholderiaceae bacterium]
MKTFHVLTTALAAAAFLAGCGGNDAGDQSPRVAFKTMVNFGDSLSDVGTYDVGAVALQGGGHYSINGKGATGLAYINWTEFLAATLQLPQPCAAETGLDTIQAVIGVPAVPATFHDTGATPCYDYAQGGARVTADVGPGNAALFNAQDQSTYSDAIGQLTVPVKTQIANYTLHGGTFDGDDKLFTVFAGGNDLFMQVGIIQATPVAQQAAAAQAAGVAMATAGAEEAAYVNQMIAAGAKHVVVVLLPDVSLTPYAISAGATGQALVLQLTQAFNAQLTKGLQASDSLLVVDAFSASQDQAAHMSQYGLINVTAPACTSSSSLVCTANTLVSTPDDLAADPTKANGYQYADSVHPTPYGYKLLAQLVGEQMAIKGWL